MSVRFRVLGAPGRDNALLAYVDSGRDVVRMLFDCGEGCLSSVPLSEVHQIDALLFSHLHMDHVAGFDSFFRATYGRTSRPNRIYGPPQTVAIMQHRMRGFLWNLQDGAPGEWTVFDIHQERVDGARFRLGEAFAQLHPLPAQPRDGAVLQTPSYSLHALEMDHMTPSLAYVIREPPRLRVDAERLAGLGLERGPWLQTLKLPPAEAPLTLELGGEQRELAALRAALLTETPGESLAYLTDFLLDEPARERLLPALRGCTTLMCESQYLHDDRELAVRNHHMTATQAAGLAREAGVGRLVLFHVSDRYRAPELITMLAEARAIFPETYFPEHWAV